MNQPKGNADDLTTQWVRAAIAGEQMGLSRTIQRFTPLMLLQAQRHLATLKRPFCDAEDLVQDAWERTLPRLDQIVPREGRFTPVLVRFLSTTLLNRYNALLERQIRRNDQSWKEELAPSSHRPLLAKLVAAEAHGEAMCALATLSPTDRALIVYRLIENLPNTIVANRLNLRPNTTAARLRRALLHLRELLPGSIFEEVDLP